MQAGRLRSLSGVNMKEWRVRGYLPHRDKIGLKQHITFSLFDSLPKQVKERIKNELIILKRNLEIGNYSDDKLKEKWLMKN